MANWEGPGEDTHIDAGPGWIFSLRDQGSGWMEKLKGPVQRTGMSLSPTAKRVDVGKRRPAVGNRSADRAGCGEECSVRGEVLFSLNMDEHCIPGGTGHRSIR